MPGFDVWEITFTNRRDDLQVPFKTSGFRNDAGYESKALLHKSLVGEYAIKRAANSCRLALSPEEATQSLRFTEVRDGKDIRVVISAVAEGSAAQQA